MKSKLLTELRRTYVNILAKNSMLYHFDENIDNIPSLRNKLSTEEYIVLQRLTDALYGDGEELFELALKRSK